MRNAKSVDILKPFLIVLLLHFVYFVNNSLIIFTRFALRSKKRNIIKNLNPNRNKKMFQYF